MGGSAKSSLWFARWLDRERFPPTKIFEYKWYARIKRKFFGTNGVPLEVLYSVRSKFILLSSFAISYVFDQPMRLQVGSDWKKSFRNFQPKICAKRKAPRASSTESAR